MWYNRLSEHLTTKGYVNSLICPCVLIKKTFSEFVIIVVYVDDLHIIETKGEIQKTSEHLKGEFEMKDLGQTKYCFGLQIEHFKKKYICTPVYIYEKTVEMIQHGKATPLRTPIVVISLMLK